MNREKQVRRDVQQKRINQTILGSDYYRYDKALRSRKYELAAELLAAYSGMVPQTIANLFAYNEGKVPERGPGRFSIPRAVERMINNSGGGVLEFE